MRLTELSANRSTFKTVRFNREGITLIVGRHKATKTTDLKKTYNGVGKSLIVALINYCFGSNKNVHFDTHLDGWTFYLTFEHAGVSHRIARSPGHSKVTYDDKEMGVKALREQLKSLKLFDFPLMDINYLTFRTLLPFFLRPRRSSYVSYAKPEPDWTDYQSILAQSFLLGIDFKRAVKKHDQKVKLDLQTELAARYKKDKELKEFYLGEKNAEVELVELNTKIATLEADLVAFRVAENYNERQAVADSLHKSISEISNELVILRNLLKDIHLSLEVRPDVSPEQVIAVYNEAKLALPDLVQKRLNDVEAFHQKLHQNRLERLTREQNDVEQKIGDLNLLLTKKKRELDAELQFLNAHRALDEYSENSAHLSDMRGRLQRIQDYLKLVTQYTEEAQKVKAEMAQDTVETNQYLRDIKVHLSTLMERFREYSKELYGSVPAGLTVNNNGGENQLRYDIHAHIENDAADGINEGKLFCYDFLLLTLRQRHDMEFLFHDNRLFADMDKHQRFTLFKMADRVTREKKLQYIASVNEDVIDSVKDLAGGEFKRLFEDTVVLNLTDASNGTGKLLGIQVDMPYDDD